VNFRFWIEEANAEQSLAMVFDLNKFAVGGRRAAAATVRDAKDFTGINPRMTGNNAVGLARFENDSWQWVHSFYLVGTLRCGVRSSQRDDPTIFNLRPEWNQISADKKRKVP